MEQTEKLDFLIQSLVKLSRMESGIIAVHPEDTTIAQMFASVQQQFNVKVREKNISLSLCDTDLHVRCDPKWTVEALGNIVDNAIKYTARGGKIKIKAGQYSFFVKIDISDISETSWKHCYDKVCIVKINTDFFDGRMA